MYIYIYIYIYTYWPISTLHRPLDFAAASAKRRSFMRFVMPWGQMGPRLTGSLQKYLLHKTKTRKLG